MLSYALIKSWVELVTGYDSQNVILATGNGPRPTGDYATFKILLDESADFSTEYRTLNPDDSVDVEHLNRSIVTVDLNVYAFDGREKLIQLSNSWVLQSVREILQPEEVVLIGGQGVRDLTELGDTKWRPRFQTECRFRAWSSLSSSNQRIIEVDATGEVEGVPLSVKTSNP